MTLPFWRTAAASCLLAAGMVVTTGGAPAFADPGSGATDGATAGATSGGPDTTTQPRPLARVTQSVRTTLDEVTTTLAASRQRLRQSLAGQTGTAKESPLATVSSGLAETTPITRTVTGVLDATPTDDVDGLTPTDDSVIAPAAGAAVPDVASPVIDAFASTANQLASIPASATTTALTTVTSLVDPVTTELSIASLTAPIPDVIASLQELLTATTDAFAPLTALPSDLASLFAVAGTSPTSPSVGSGVAASGLPGAAPPQLIQLLTGTPDGIRTDANAVVPTPTIDLTAALGRASSASTSARVAPDGVVPGGIQAFFASEGGLIAIVAVSLSALAAAAVPGIAGLLASAAAGVRLGYRQAKTQMAIRASGIARFAVGGPVGVVRSGNLVSLRPRTAHVARSNADGLSRHVA